MSATGRGTGSSRPPRRWRGRCSGPWPACLTSRSPAVLRHQQHLLRDRRRRPAGAPSRTGPSAARRRRRQAGQPHRRRRRRAGPGGGVPDLGKRKDHRDDLPQIVVGMAVTRSGIPVRVWSWLNAVAFRDHFSMTGVASGGLAPGLSSLVWVIEELVPDGLWERIAPLLPPPKPRRRRYPGRRPINDRAAVAGIVFVLKTGITWNQLPTSLVGCSGVTCWRRFAGLDRSRRLARPARTAAGPAAGARRAGPEPLRGRRLARPSAQKMTCGGTPSAQRTVGASAVGA